MHEDDRNEFLEDCGLDYWRGFGLVTNGGKVFYFDYSSVKLSLPVEDFAGGAEVERATGGQNITPLIGILIRYYLTQIQLLQWRDKLIINMIG